MSSVRAAGGAVPGTTSGIFIKVSRLSSVPVGRQVVSEVR